MLRNAKDAEDKVTEACEKKICKFKSSEEYKRNIYEEAFCFFSIRFNQGLKAARDALDVPLAILQTIEFDFDGDQVQYREDNNPIPKTCPALMHAHLMSSPPTSPTSSVINKDLISIAANSLAAFATNPVDVPKP